MGAFSAPGFNLLPVLFNLHGAPLGTGFKPLSFLRYFRGRIPAAFNDPCQPLLGTAFRAYADSSPLAFHTGHRNQRGLWPTGKNLCLSDPDRIDGCLYHHHLYNLVGSRKMLKLRLNAIDHWVGKSVHLLRTWLARYRNRVFSEILDLMQTDAQLLAFHCGKTDILPGFYAYTYKRQLGKYAELMTIEESRPILATSVFH